MIEGSEASPGYIFTDNGVPAMDASHGFQLGLADDLVNELLAEIHALGVLDLTVQQDFGVFDAAHFDPSPVNGVPGDYPLPGRRILVKATWRVR